MDGERKVMLGPKVRRLRRSFGLTQAAMAEKLGISASYINLVEHNQRPVSVPLLLKLGRTFDLDLHDFAVDEEAHLVSGLREVFADPVFEGLDLHAQDMRDLADLGPGMADAVMRLYRSFRDARDELRALSEHVSEDRLAIAGAVTPVDEVREFFHDHANHFPELEAAAEALWEDGGLSRGDLFHGLGEILRRRHDLSVAIEPGDEMDGAVRILDRDAGRVRLADSLAGSGRVFQLAAVIGHLTQADLLARLAESYAFSGPEARGLARIGLTNYFAGAVMMPYARFVAAARACRYDIKVLEGRFDASFEQVCHRLTTLQRPGDKGVPFFLIRIDKAGNVSKRFTAGGFQFARFGGPCPRWNVHDAFRTPGIERTQMLRMPDGDMYFSIACAVATAPAGYREPPQEFAIALGCHVGDADQLIYSDGVDLENADAATPIGLNCRICERLDCAQRAYPPINHRLRVDPDRRGPIPFGFETAS